MKLKRNQIILFILIVGISISGCAQSVPNEISKTEEPIIQNTEVISPTEIVEISEDHTPEPTQSPVPTASVEFIDYYYSEFEDVDEWAVFSKYDQELNNIDVSEDGLTLSFSDEDDYILAYSNVIGSNTIVETKIDLIEDPGPIIFQLICRSTEVGEYIFEISTSGSWEIGNFNFESQSYESISEGILNIDISSEQVIVIKVVCDMDILSLQVNEELIEQISDESYSEGYVGFNIRNGSNSQKKLNVNYFFISAP